MLHDQQRTVTVELVQTSELIPHPHTIDETNVIGGTYIGGSEDYLVLFGTFLDVKSYYVVPRSEIRLMRFGLTKAQREADDKKQN